MVPMSTVVLPTDDGAGGPAVTIGAWPAAGVRPRRLKLSEEDLCDWLGTAFPGDTIEYHRGHLAVDQVPRSPLSDADCRQLSRVARRALIFAEEGRAHLVQRRHGDGDYSYLAIKARAPARRRR